MRGKSTLKSFSFGSYLGVDELPDEVLMLFIELLEKPGKSIEYVEEIINAALMGRIDFTKPFKIDAYEYKIRSSAHINSEKERKRKTFIDFSSNDTEREVSMRNGGVTIDSVSTSAIEELKDAYDEVLDNIELQEAVSNIKGLNDTFRVDYGINLIKLLQKGVSGYPQAIKRLKEVCNEFNQVSEWVQVILKSGHPVDSLVLDNDGVAITVLSEVRDSCVVAEKETIEEVAEVKSNNAVVVDIRDMFRKEKAMKADEETVITDDSLVVAEVIELVAEEEKEIFGVVAEINPNTEKVVAIRDMFRKSSNTELVGVSAIGACLTVEDVLEKEVVNDVTGVSSESDDILFVSSEDDLILAVSNFQANISTNRFIYSTNMKELLKRSDSRYPQSSEKLRDVGDKYEPELRGAENSHQIVLFYPDRDKVINLAEVRSKKEGVNSLHCNRGVSPSNRCRAVSNRAIPMCLGKEIQTYSATG